MVSDGKTKVWPMKTHGPKKAVFLRYRDIGIVPWYGALKNEIVPSVSSGWKSRCTMASLTRGSALRYRDARWFIS